MPFLQTPTRHEWSTYRSWVRKQKNKGKKEKNHTLGLVEGVQLTEECLFTLSPTEWLNDSVIQASIKSILNANPLESSVGFLPTFFYTKLMNIGHENPEREGRYEYKGVRTWFKKTFGEEKKVSDMSTLVILQNQERRHWVCYGIFLESKFIQVFDSLGGGDANALRGIYHWLHDSMDEEGTELKPQDWCLYKTRSSQSYQRNGYDCGLFSILFSLCIAKGLPLNLVNQSIMNDGRCQLWLHLMSLLKKSKKPLDLITPPPAPPGRSTGSVVDLRSPTKVSHLPGDG
jgi:Ulp1 family protease